MRGEKEIRETLKRLKEEHLRRMQQPGTYATHGMVGIIGALEWVLGDKERLPDIV